MHHLEEWSLAANKSIDKPGGGRTWKGNQLDVLASSIIVTNLFLWQVTQIVVAILLNICSESHHHRRSWHSLNENANCTVNYFY